MRFDDTLNVIGEFGPYQRRIYILLCLPIIFIGISDVNNALLLYTPRYRCNRDNNHTKQLEYQRTTTEQIANDASYSQDAGECYTGQTNMSDQVVEPCTSWTYDNDVFVSTFVTEHDLVCDNAGIAAYMQMFIYVGALLGSLMQGFVADRFGRKWVICASLVVVLASGLTSSWSTNCYMFTVLRLLQIMASRGVYITCFVQAIEMVGPSKRRWAAFPFNYFYSAGIAILPGIGYGLRHWKYIQIVCTAPMVIFLFYWWIIPESPRWLISRGRMEDARKIIRKIAASNNMESCIPLNDEILEESGKPERKYSIWHYFANQSLLFHSLIIFFNVFVMYHCFVGFSLNTENLSGDFFVNFMIGGLVDFPAYTIALLFSKRIGRKTLYIVGMTVAGASLLASTAVTVLTTDFKIVSLILAMLGKTGISVGFCVMFTWAAELFPTVIRNTGMGLSTAFGTIGLIVAPYVASLATVFPGRTGRAAPLIVFGVLSLMGAFFSIWLPETQKQHLPETLVHATHLSRKGAREFDIREE